MKTALLGILCAVSVVQAAEIAGTLTVCNAGSLAAPLARALEELRGRHPAVHPAQESAGSLDIVRRATELGRPCDVLAVADYEVLPALVVPKHAAWYAVFARNRLAIAYRPESRGAADLEHKPWYDVLLGPGVEVGYADPYADPAGYRTLMAFQLAERHYGVRGLAERLRAKVPARNLRPKSVELVALLQAGELDYVWTYRSVAEGASLRALALPPEVDLGDPSRAGLYASVAVEVAGNTPGTRRTVHGLPILYGLTIPNAAPNPEAATAFVAFLTTETGRTLLRDAHLDPVDPPQANDPKAMPTSLRALLAPLAFAPPAR